MKGARASLAAAVFAAWAASEFGAEAGMALLPAGSLTPFLRLKAPNPSVPAPPNLAAIGAFRLDVEPVTNAKFLDFVWRIQSGASRGSSRCLQTRAI